MHSPHHKVPALPSVVVRGAGMSPQPQGRPPCALKGPGAAGALPGAAFFHTVADPKNAARGPRGMDSVPHGLCGILALLLVTQTALLS